MTMAAGAMMCTGRLVGTVGRAQDMFVKHKDVMVDPSEDYCRYDALFL